MVFGVRCLQKGGERCLHGRLNMRSFLLTGASRGSF